MISAELKLEGEGARAESVSEFTRRVKTRLERGLRPGWVRGEGSTLRLQASGHVDFCLKDAGAQLSAVLFRGDAIRQTVKLRDGKRLVTDGPYAETKEQLGGFYIVEAKSLDEAIEWAAKMLGLDRDTIEVRPLRDFSGVDFSTAEPQSADSQA